jgi:magnesium-transporting ATPase (P-type)
MDNIRAHEHAYGAQGYRVLACAQRLRASVDVALREEDLTDMTFLGLVAMTDPPRADVHRSIAVCRRAGVAVKMITGDHRATAEAIARAVGIGGSELVAYNGRELERMSDGELEHAAQTGSVFARVSPEVKFRLVAALQRQSHIVAMTGDGVNDAPALQSADIGIAMGRSGTDVAKDASSMVLTDDNFATIVAAIEEGRTVYDNIRSYVTFTISTDVGEGLVVLAAVALGIALPILPVQILWINLTTGVVLGLPLAVEPTAPHIMHRTPAESHEELLGGFLIWRTISVGAYLLASAFGLYMWETSQGSTIEHARTVAATAFVVLQIFYLIACRSHTRPGHHGLVEQRVLWASIIGMLALQVIFVYAPFAQRFFGTASIDMQSWFVVTALGAVLYAGVELEKYLRVRRVQRARR